MKTLRKATKFIITMSDLGNESTNGLEMLQANVLKPYDNRGLLSVVSQCVVRRLHATKSSVRKSFKQNKSCTLR